MPGSLATQTLQMLTVWEELIRLEPRLKTLLPADLAQLKEHLRKLHPEGGAERAADYDLFYRIGVALSHQQKPMTMGDLSGALAVPLSTATRMVDWLVESGYVTRLPDAEDRRIVRVTLTKTGQELYQTINKFIRQHIEELLREFTTEERAEFVVLLRKFIKALERMVG